MSAAQDTFIAGWEACEHKWLGPSAAGYPTEVEAAWELFALGNSGVLTSEATVAELQAEITRRDAVAHGSWGDQEDEHTPAIEAAHPMVTKDHDTFAQAMALVGKRRGKYELVNLVNWLLKRASVAEREADMGKQAVRTLARVRSIAESYTSANPAAKAIRRVISDTWHTGAALAATSEGEAK